MNGMVVRKPLGLTLIEVIVAVFILALAFLPIIGVFGGSLKATGKEDSLNRGMNLCQEKLNTALQFPFDYFVPVLNTDLVAPIATTTPAISLHLGSETVQGVTFSSTLKVTNRPGNFSVPVRDLTVGNPDDPKTWVFTTITVPYTDLVHVYSMRVSWINKGEKTARFYTLVTFRAKLRS